MAGAIAGFIAAVVFFYTAAPNVTLEDSGESATAMINFGVCHPPGYPLWTFLAFIFTSLLPGNPGWKCNLFCGMWGALGVGLTTVLIANTLRWFSESLTLTEDTRRRVPAMASIVGIGFALAFGFTLPQWSQATVTSTYTFHAFLGLLIYTAMYWWVRDYSNPYKFIAIVFAYSLSMSNHHMTLALMFVGPILLLLTRYEDFIEYGIWLASGLSLLLLGFGWLSNYSPSELIPNSSATPVWNMGVRSTLTCLIIIGLLFWIRGSKTQWKLGLCLIGAMFLGLLPYAYLPIASSTNPPMNWSYAREPAGFYYAINRSQYGASLSDMLLRSFGRATGARPPSDQNSQRDPRTPFDNEGFVNQLNVFSPALGRVIPFVDRIIPLPKQAIQSWLPWLIHTRGYVSHQWGGIIGIVTPLAIIFFFIGFLCFFILEIDQRAWLLTLMSGFLFSAFLNGIINQHATSVMGWLLEFRWLTMPMALLMILAALGFGICAIKLINRFRIPWLAAGFVLALPALLFLKTGALWQTNEGIGGDGISVTTC